MTVPESIQNALQELGVLPDDLLLCAVSGGGDSVSLAAAVHAAGFRRLRLAWINHNLRPADETLLDLRTVQDLAKRLDVPLDREELSEDTIQSRVRATNQSLEQVARQIRYEALVRLASQWPASTLTPVYLLAAHHRDDQAETVLSRIADGHPPTVPVAIPRRRILSEEPVKVVLVRPALDLPGRLLREWGAREGLTWNEDSTNRDERFRRNALRLRVLPSLTEVLPDSSRMIARYGSNHDRLLSGLQALIPSEARGSMDMDHASWVVERDIFLRLPEAARELVMREAAYKLSESPRLSSGFITEVLRRVQSYGTDSTRLKVSGADLVCEATDTVIRMTRDVVPMGQRGYLWPVPAGSIVDLDTDGDGLFPTRDSKVPSVGDRCVAVTSIAFPAVLREYRSGDAILWSGRMRTLSEVAHRRNVPKNLRSGAAILESGAGLEAAFWPRRQLVVRDGRTWLEDGVNYRQSAVIFRIRG